MKAILISICLLLPSVSFATAASTKPALAHCEKFERLTPAQKKKTAAARKISLGKIEADCRALFRRSADYQRGYQDDLDRNPSYGGGLESPRRHSSGTTICSDGVCSGPDGVTSCAGGICSGPNGFTNCVGGVCSGREGPTTCFNGMCNGPGGPTVCTNGICSGADGGAVCGSGIACY